MGLACVTLGAPTVTLAEGSPRIGLAADVLVTLGRRELPGKVAFSGVLRYVRYQGDFYLDDVQIDDFALEGFPPELAEVVRSRGPGAILTFGGAIGLSARDWRLRLTATQANSVGEPAPDASSLSLDLLGPWSAPSIVPALNGG